MPEYRKQLDTTAELGAWYDAKYTEMGDGWFIPAAECNEHLDNLGVVNDPSLTLLDVGCGVGHVLAQAVKRVSASGCEISTVGIRWCRVRAPGAFIHEVSIEDWYYWCGIKPFDYIVSIGSIEHIVDLDTALDNIRKLLKPTGRFYFYCPNELWAHFDQPNERTMTDEEWIDLFLSHGLHTQWHRRMNDNTIFCGDGLAEAMP